MSPRLERFLEAIYEMEGFYLTKEAAKRRGIAWPTVAQRSNNPGNVTYGKFAEGRGAEPYTVAGKDGKRRTYARFATPEEGRAAAEALVRKYADRAPMTLLDAIRKWAPAEDANDPAGYACYVARCVGVALDTPLASIVADT